jgi:hypothetical protein
LKEKILAPRIRNFLNNDDFKDEFAHTILHKQNIFDKAHLQMLERERREQEEQRIQEEISARQMALQAEQNRYDEVDLPQQNYYN